MTNDYWYLRTTDDSIIDPVANWALSHIDLIDLVEIDTHRLVLHIIPDKIIPRFNDYRDLLEILIDSQVETIGYWPGGAYLIKINKKTLEAINNGFGQITIDLETRRICVWVTDKGTGKKTLVRGLSPMNYSRMSSRPEYFPKFVIIGYGY